MQINNYIGVIDYEDYAKNLINKNNYVSYCSTDGSICPSGEFEGNGFQEGDTVTVTVNRNTQKIQWNVKNTNIVTFDASFLGNKRVKVYPFIHLSPGGIVEFTI